MAESRIIPWITITVEAVAIVLSILMAFAIDAWWAEKKENDVEQVALLALSSDFMASREQLAGVLLSLESARTDFAHFQSVTTAELVEIDPDAIRYGRVGDYGGLTALLHATREGHRDVAVALLDSGADIEQIGTAEGVSPLLMAVANGHFDLAMYLLERGANPSFASKSGNNPLYATLDAQWAGKSTARPRQRSYEQQETTYLELAETLLRAGVDPNVRLKTAPPYEPRANSSVGLTGATAFFRATYATDVAAMRLLVADGADHTLTTIKSTAAAESSMVERALTLVSAAWTSACRARSSTDDR